MSAEMCTPESPTCDGHRNGRSWLLQCPRPPSAVEAQRMRPDLVEAVREALENLDLMCRDEDLNGSDIRAHEIRDAVRELRAQITT